MDLFIFREPISAWTHGAWMFLCLPAGLYLQRQARGPLKRIGFGVFTLSLVCCFFGSWLYHSVHPPERVDLCGRLDYMGIFLLIAGTMTPVMLIALDGWWRVTTLFFTWSIALTGIVIRACNVPLPDQVSTGIYIVMGWTSLLCYVELGRRLTFRALRLVWVGGVIYSVGAILNGVHWPNFWPGVFAAHELFHLFVMTASFCHFLFMLRVLAPFEPPTPLPVESVPALTLLPEQAPA